MGGGGGGGGGLLGPQLDNCIYYNSKLSKNRTLFMNFVFFILILHLSVFIYPWHD